MSFDVLRSPVQFLQQVEICADQDWLREYEAWFEREGQGISDAVDRAGTPWLRMFDRWGARVDEILYPLHGFCGRRVLHGRSAGLAGPGRSSSYRTYRRSLDDGCPLA